MTTGYKQFSRLNQPQHCDGCNVILSGNFDRQFSKSTESVFATHMLRLLLQVSVNITERIPTETDLLFEESNALCFDRDSRYVTLAKSTGDHLQ